MKEISDQDYWDCKKCGRCCKIFRLPVNNKDNLVKKFEDHFEFKLESYEVEVIFKGNCEHYKNGLCSIYEKRPEMCKNFFCKKHVKDSVPRGQIYEKRCQMCLNIRKFQAGTPRDRESICGNCWDWDREHAELNHK